jgi:phosphatidylglycerol:prolipoprotein diacylglycerol transferase
MLIAPEIDPVAIAIGPLRIHWYGLMYVLGFVGAWWLGTLRARRGDSGWSVDEVGDMIVTGAFGVVIGGRLGYVLFYKPVYFLQHPLETFFIWQGGMSFHGGLIGVVLAMMWFARKTQRPWLVVQDFLAPLVPVGLATGRLGNFLNQELWGRVTDMPWGMVFRTGGPLPRHPSQLYEFALEGVVMFALLLLYSRRPRPMGAITGLFGVLYGAFRIVVEFFREPDAHLGYLAFGWLTMGQVLSVPLVVLGAAMMVWAYRREARAAGGN